MSAFDEKWAKNCYWLPFVDVQNLQMQLINALPVLIESIDVYMSSCWMLASRLIV